MIERNRFNSIVCYCHTSILSVCFWLNQRRTIVGNQSIHWIDSNGRDGSPSRCWIFVSASVRFGTFQWQKKHHWRPGASICRGFLQRPSMCDMLQCVYSWVAQQTVRLEKFPCGNWHQRLQMLWTHSCQGEVSTVQQQQWLNL